MGMGGAEFTAFKAYNSLVSDWNSISTNFSLSPSGVDPKEIPSKLTIQSISQGTWPNRLTLEFERASQPLFLGKTLTWKNESRSIQSEDTKKNLEEKDSAENIKLNFSQRDKFYS